MAATKPRPRTAARIPSIPVAPSVSESQGLLALWELPWKTLCSLAHTKRILCPAILFLAGRGSIGSSPDVRTPCRRQARRPAGASRTACSWACGIKNILSVSQNRFKLRPNDLIVGEGRRGDNRHMADTAATSPLLRDLRFFHAPSGGVRGRRSRPRTPPLGRSGGAKGPSRPPQMNLSLDVRLLPA